MSNQQWEYATDTFYYYGNDIGSWLNGWGAEGWEIVHAHFNPSVMSYSDEYYRFIFKRPKPQQNDQ